MLALLKSHHQTKQMKENKIWASKKEQSLTKSSHQNSSAVKLGKSSQKKILKYDPPPI